MNFLLVGNSRLHWAKYSQNQSKFFHTKKDQKVPEDIDLDQLIWASVGKIPNFFLKKENEIKTKDIQLSMCIPHSCVIPPNLVSLPCVSIPSGMLECLSPTVE